MMGRELVGRYINSTDTPISTGEVVYAAEANNEIALGLAAIEAKPGEVGYVIAYGYAREVDTSAFEVGALLWADTEGNLVGREPDEHGADLFIGVVVASDTDHGVVYIRTENGEEVLMDRAVERWASGGAPYLGKRI
jgi:hypothetical protein